MTKHVLRPCLYCDVPGRSKEHVLPQMFGVYENNLTVWDVCADCNQIHFGQKLETKFCRNSAEAIFRLVFGLKSPEKAREIGGDRVTAIYLEPDTPIRSTSTVLQDHSELVALVSNKGVVPLAVARRIVEQEFMTVLANAPFDPEDPTLSPLGKCSTCPARSGNNRDLFGDIRGKNVCTNLADFHLKITTFLTRLRDEGYTVLLSPAEIREAFPYNTAHPGDRYLDLDRPCHDNPKKRTYDALLSDETKKSTVYTYVGGRLWRLFPRDLLSPALEASGHRFLQKQMERTPDPAQRELRLQQRIERAVRTAVATDFSEKVAREGAASGVDRSHGARGARRPELDHR